VRTATEMPRFRWSRQSMRDILYENDGEGQTSPSHRRVPVSRAKRVLDSGLRRNDGGVRED